MNAPPSPPISERLARFAETLPGEAIPPGCRAHARLHFLDSVGIALASLTKDYAHHTYTALQGLAGDGRHLVFGMPRGLPARDAAILNGVLVHGLDYDDTHLAGVIHVSASQVPVAIAAGELAGASGRDVLTALIVGTEAACRLAMGAGGLFHRAEFQPTGTVGAFGAALAAGRLLGLNALQLRWAQGIVLGMGSSNLAFNAEGSWTKRLFPGWAAAAGLTAATLARQGFTGPLDPYLGRGGLYRTHLGGADVAASVDAGAVLDGLGERWETEVVAIKPYPACHLAHGCIEAAIDLKRRHGFATRDVASVRAVVHTAAVTGICEPVARKQRPATVYEAQFGLQFLVATALHRGQVSLHELAPAGLSDPDVLALAARTTYGADATFDHPRSFGGEVEVVLADGTRLSCRHDVNLGAAERPVGDDFIERKFFDNATLSVSRARAEAIRDAVLGIDEAPTLAPLSDALRG